MEEEFIEKSIIGFTEIEALHFLGGEDQVQYVH